MMPYNFEYHVRLDQSHILPNILKGAQTGVISQFISDIIISLLFFNEKSSLKIFKSAKFLLIMLPSPAE